MMPNQSTWPSGWTIRVFDDLATLPAQHVSLFDHCAHRSVFLTLPWFRNLARCVLKGAEHARVYAVETADSSHQPIAALVTRPGQRALPWAGRKLSALSNFYTPVFAPLIHHDYADSQRTRESMTALANAIVKEHPQWDALEFQPLDFESPACQSFEEALRTTGWLVDRFFCFGNWYLNVGGQSFRDYFAGRPKKLTQNAPRSRRKLETSGRMRLDIVNSRDGLEAAKHAYHAIYNSSWKQAEPFPEFIDGLLDFTADLGWLRLGVIHIDGVPAAAQIWLVADGTASIFKMAYDGRFAKESAGTVLSSCLMEHVIDVDKVKVVDYLSGDDAYKRDWMSHRRERWGLIALNPRSVRGLGAAARHFGGRTLRRLFPATARIPAAANVAR